MPTHEESLERLLEGHRRFIAGRSSRAPDLTARRRDLEEGQSPFAVVLGCSDSRVPPELVFDQALGDLFVVRVAGNVVAAQLVGSVEFAVEALGCPLIMVLGHSRCGAVEATFDVLENPETTLSSGLGAVVDAIRPAVAPLISGDQPRAQRLAMAVRANVVVACRRLRESSPLLDARIADGALRVVGAEYALDTGQIEIICDSESAA